MKKTITFLLSICMIVASIFISGCVEEVKPADNSTSWEESVGGSDSAGGSDSSSTQRPPQGTPFTIELKTADGMPLPSTSGISAIWTDLNGVNIYQAPVDGEGKATCYGPDGEYQVTLTGTPKGYTYNPNVYFADNNDAHKVIDLYPLRTWSGGDGSQYNSYKAQTTGAYRFVFDTPNTEIYFRFGAKYSGKISVESILDVTENEVTPIFYRCYSTFYAEVQYTIVGGGAENSYTKNFYYDYSVTGSQEMLFKIGVETVNAKRFPVEIDVLVTKEGEYEGAGVTLEEVPVPENLVDYSKATKPSGTWTLYSSNVYTFDQTKIIYVEEEDAYYTKKADGTPDKKLYVALSGDIPGILEAEGGGMANGMVSKKCYSSGKDYSKFYDAHLDKSYSNGTYPLSSALKEFLSDFAESKQLFYDGNGSAESSGYSSDKYSWWLFGCGYYK